LATRFFLDIFAWFIHKIVLDRLSSVAMTDQLVGLLLIHIAQVRFHPLCDANITPGELALIKRSYYRVSVQEGMADTDNRNPSLKQASPDPGSNLVIDKILFFK
jgi:hypothetical protein